MWRYSNFLVGFQDLLLKQQKLPIYWWFIAPRKIAKLEMVDPIDIPTLFGLPSGNQKWQSKIHHLHIPSKKKNSICRECPVATFDDTGGYRPWVFYDPILIHITPPQKKKKHIKLPVNLHFFMVNWYVNQVTGIRRQIRRLTLFTLAPQIRPRAERIRGS